MSGEQMSLAGRVVLVTRPRRRAVRLMRALERHGAEVLLAPVIRTAPPEEWGPADLAIERLPQYQWLVITSPHGVDAFVERLLARDRDVRELHGVRLAAIGAKTAERLREVGLRADLVPDEYRAEALAEALVEAGVAGRTVLLARSAVSRPVLVDELRRAGAFVDEVATYTIVPEDGLDEEVATALRRGRADLLTFTSSSTVERYLELAEESEVHEAARRVPAACIGPVTAATAEEHGLEVVAVAEPYTIEALVDAVVRHFGGG